ncbi:hypothetical protein NECAME_17548 [Necator americanus]|uniref:Uncharacterized protein n=1 Tax=Necator americanus TaxID=51031 RepID=W2TM50_NECAM|nr:hypothetical protein NECAME_17548 [Necator americanus]ETN83195.1 hypothetical protein NECAME_17548 [Necator americanus]
MSLLRHLSSIFDENEEDLMNDWEIGGTQNKWVCPSDRHLHLRAQYRELPCRWKLVEIVAVAVVVVDGDDDDENQR